MFSILFLPLSKLCKVQKRLAALNHIFVFSEFIEKGKSKLFFFLKKFSTQAEYVKSYQCSSTTKAQRRVSCRNEFLHVFPSDKAKPCQYLLVVLIQILCIFSIVLVKTSTYLQGVILSVYSDYWNLTIPVVFYPLATKYLHSICLF